MTIVKLGYDMTLNVGNFSNFKPSIELTIDTDGDVAEQIEAGREAIRLAQPVVSEELERILDIEDVKDYESLLIKHGASIEKLDKRLKSMEKAWTAQTNDVKPKPRARKKKEE